MQLWTSDYSAMIAHLWTEAACSCKCTVYNEMRLCPLHAGIYLMLLKPAQLRYLLLLSCALLLHDICNFQVRTRACVPGWPNNYIKGKSTWWTQYTLLSAVDFNNNYSASLTAVNMYQRVTWVVAVMDKTKVGTVEQLRLRRRPYGRKHVIKNIKYQNAIMFKYRCSNIMKPCIFTCCCVLHKPDIETGQTGYLV